MKLTLEFVHHRRPHWAGLLMLACSLGWGAYLVQNWYELQTELAQKQNEYELQLTAYKKQQQTVTSSQKKSAATEARIKEYQHILDTLNYSWNQEFATLEQSEEKGVALLSYSHDQSSGKSTLTTEALDASAIIRYVEKLNEGSDSNRWYIEGYQAQTQSVPNTVKAVIVNNR